MEKLKKIFNPKCILNPNDLSADEKKQVYNLLGMNGASMAFAYERLFKEGFKEWELVGIDQIKKDYLSEMCLHLSSEDMNIPGKFYETLNSHRGLKSLFCRRMQDMGMTSQITVIRRFTQDNWKSYERRGIRAILSELYAEEEERTGS